MLRVLKLANGQRNAKCANGNDNHSVDKKSKPSSAKNDAHDALVAQHGAVARNNEDYGP
jgi:hypothetical protein